MWLARGFDTSKVPFISSAYTRNLPTENNPAPRSTHVERDNLNALARHVSIQTACDALDGPTTIEMNPNALD